VATTTVSVRLQRFRIAGGREGGPWLGGVRADRRGL